MEFSERRVACRTIDTDDKTYRISTGQDIQALTDSIAALGLIHPPIVMSKKDKFSIVSGFKRVQVCHRIGMQCIPVRIASDHPSELAYAKLAVADNSFQRTLNLVELSRAVTLLKPHFDSMAALATTAGELCLPANPDFLKKVAPLTTLSQSIQKQIVSGDIALPTAVELLACDPASISVLADIFGALKLSLNKQREVMTLLKEIAAIEDSSIAEVLQDELFQSLLSEKELDMAQKRLRFRSRLKGRRFPALTRVEKQLLGLIKQLPLGRYWQINPPKHFEAPSYVFKATVGNSDELADACNQLRKILQAPALKKIFKLAVKI